MPLITRLHRFIVWDFNNGSPGATRFSFFVPVLIALSPLTFLERPFEGWDLFIFALTGSLGAAMLGFVAWRLSRIAKTQAIRGDRQYDRRDKYRLPAEYLTSESSTRATRRKRRQK